MTELFNVSQNHISPFPEIEDQERRVLLTADECTETHLTFSPFEGKKKYKYHDICINGTYKKYAIYPLKLTLLPALIEISQR